MTAILAYQGLDFVVLAADQYMSTFTNTDESTRRIGVDDKIKHGVNHYFSISGRTRWIEALGLMQTPLHEILSWDPFELTDDSNVDFSLFLVDPTEARLYSGDSPGPSLQRAIEGEIWWGGVDYDRTPLIEQLGDLSPTNPQDVAELFKLNIEDVAKITDVVVGHMVYIFHGDGNVEKYSISSLETTPKTFRIEIDENLDLQATDPSSVLQRNALIWAVRHGLFNPGNDAHMGELYDRIKELSE